MINLSMVPVAYFKGDFSWGYNRNSVMLVIESRASYIPTLVAPLTISGLTFLRKIYGSKIPNNLPKPTQISVYILESEFHLLS